MWVVAPCLVLIEVSYHHQMMVLLRMRTTRMSLIESKVKRIEMSMNQLQAGRSRLGARKVLNLLVVMLLQGLLEKAQSFAVKPSTSYVLSSNRSVKRSSNRSSSLSIKRSQSV